MNDIPTLPTDSLQARPAQGRPWFFRLETWLVLAGLFLVFQVFPGLFWGLLYLIDVRNWSWGAWVGAEIGAVIILLALWRWQKS
jgi:hypothetical protein